jgi:ectoine hydroxylase-related dioxygenase (phytanoyl-CoA dioxygenase family)
VLTFGVAIDPLSAANGAMQVVPGSHKLKTWDHHHEGNFCGAVTEPGFDAAAMGAIPLEVAAGKITIHHVRAGARNAGAPGSSPEPAWPLSASRLAHLLPV